MLAAPRLRIPQALRPRGFAHEEHFDQPFDAPSTSEKGFAISGHPERPRESTGLNLAIVAAAVTPIENARIGETASASTELSFNKINFLSGARTMQLTRRAWRRRYVNGDFANSDEKRIVNLSVNAAGADEIMSTVIWRAEKSSTYILTLSGPLILELILYY